MPAPPAIHPTAVVSPEARLEAGVSIGPYAVVEADVILGPETRIAAHAVIMAGTTLGARVAVHSGAVVGDVPQVRQRGDTPGRLSVGDDACIREHVTVHRASRPESTTHIGAGAYLMAGSHVAHDCVIGAGVVLANGALLAGHVRVDDDAFVSGNVVVHQHVRLGMRCLIRGGSAVGKDVLPFTIVAGTSRVRGLNTIGLRRGGVPPGERVALQRAYRLLFRSGLPLHTAIAELRRWPPSPVLEQMLAFAEATTRGLCRPRARVAARGRSPYARVDLAG
jgi:UDP-N-acetylglucosamine acyltransferase